MLLFPFFAVCYSEAFELASESDESVIDGGKTTECWERRKQLNERSSAMQISLKHFAYFVLESAFMIVPRFNQVHLIVV